MKRLLLALPLLTACATGPVAPAFSQESDVFPGFPSCTLAGGHVGLYDDGTDTCKASMTELVGFLDGSFLLLDASNDPVTGDLDLGAKLLLTGAGDEATVRARGDAGGGGAGFTYKDTGGNDRYGLGFTSGVVWLGNRASNGVVHLRANTSTAGLGGEVTAVVVEDNEVQLLPSGGNVGIGTAVPSAALHIVDSVAGEYFRIGNSFDTFSAGFSANSDNSQFVLSYLASGENEIRLEADGDINLSDGVLFLDTAADEIGINDTTPDETLEVVGTLGVSATAGGDGDRLHVDGTGVGIGTTGPDGTLHAHSGSAGAVTASVDADEGVFENAGNAGISFLTPNTQTGNIFFGDPESAIIGRLTYAHSTDAMSFWTSGSEQMTIDSSGEVGIGVVDATDKLHIYRNDASADRSFLIEQDGTGDASLEFVLTVGQEFGVGIDNSDGDSFKIDNSGASFASAEVEVQAGGDVVLVESGGDVGVGVAPTTRLHVYRNDATADDAVLVEQASTGDASLEFLLTAGQSFGVGIDNSDGDSFKVDNSGAPFASAEFEISTGGNIALAESGGDVAIGIAPGGGDGTFHVRTANAGAVTANADGDDGVFENSGSAGISVLAGSGSSAWVYFGVGTDNDAGSIQVSGGELLISSNVASGIVSLKAGTGSKTHRFFDDGRFCIIASGGQICEYGKLATAPSTCTVGDTYTDTSPAKCWCSATNTWSVIVGTSCT